MRRMACHQKAKSSSSNISGRAWFNGGKKTGSGSRDAKKNIMVTSGVSAAAAWCVVVTCGWRDAA